MMKKILLLIGLLCLVSTPVFAANEVLEQDVAGSSLEQIVFNVTGSYSPADSATDWTMGGTPINGAMTLSGLASGSSWQSIKIDIGALRARRYRIFGCVDFTGEASHVTGETVDYYWAASTSSTTANGNTAGGSGTDAAAATGALGSITEAEFLNQCVWIGSLVIHDGGSVQTGYVGVFSPATRYGQLIIHNNTSDAFEADNVEHCQVMNPVVDEIQ